MHRDRYEGSLVLTRENSTHPVCYVFYDGDLPIYVGYSKHGLRRVFSANLATEPDRVDAIQIYTSVRIEIFAPRDDGYPIDDAYFREEELIHDYHPVFNRACRACNTSTHKNAINPYLWGRTEEERLAFHTRQHVQGKNTAGSAYCKYCILTQSDKV